MIIAVIFILLITLGIGLPLVLAICPKINKTSAIGLSFPIGIGIFTLLMFFSNIVGIKFSLLNESIILLVFLIPLVFFLRKRMKKFYKDLINDLKESKFSVVEKVMLGVIIFLVVTSFINTFFWPVSMWDSVVLYDFRGHVFASTGFMKNAFFNDYFYSYPLLTSLAHTITYLGGGKYPQFIYSLFYLSLGLSFFGLLREFVSRKVGILFTMLLMLTGPLFYHSLFSYTNLTYTVYVSLAAILIYLWDKKKEGGYLVLSAILTGLSTWARSNEPFWLAILFIVVVVSIYRKKIWNILIFSIFFFPIREVWKIFQGVLNGGGSSTAQEVVGYSQVFSSFFDLERLGQVGGYLYKNVAVPWGAIFVAFILSTIFLFVLKVQKKYFLIFFITYTFLGVLVAGTVQFSVSTDYWLRIGDAVQRLSMLFYPLFVYCVALVVQVKVKKKQ